MFGSPLYYDDFKLIILMVLVSLVCSCEAQKNFAMSLVGAVLDNCNVSDVSKYYADFKLIHPTLVQVKIVYDVTKVLK